MDYVRDWETHGPRAAFGRLTFTEASVIIQLQYDTKYIKIIACLRKKISLEEFAIITFYYDVFSQ